MIKKMMALLAAISCALGAWADVSGHLSGTDFSTHPVGTFETQHDDAGNPIDVDHHTYWYNGDTSDFEGTIVLGTNETDHVLDFESNITNPLYRTISTCDGVASPASFTATPIGDGLFIDTHVQFTPYLVNENHPAPTKVTDDDKLIVWVRETEVDGDANITNLIVTAGYITESGTPVASNYVSTLSSAEVSALCTNQCRLTIKSFQNITAYNGVYVMGFVVYIDESAIGYDGDAFDGNCNFIKAGLKPNPAQYYSQGGSDNKLFPCLMRYVSSSSGSIDDYSKLSAVGYAGMGKIGDVIFDSYSTTYPAFAGDDRRFSVQAGSDILSYMYTNAIYSGTSTNILTAPATATSVTISNVVYASGYKHQDDLWRNEGQVVSNRVDASGNDYGTFYFADGEVFTLVGFQANYMVVVGGVTNEFQTLLGTGGALEAALAGGTLVLNNDIVITEGDGYIALNSGTLTIDLNGHTLQGTHATWATIENLGGTLTITDTSSSHTGKLLDSPGLYCLAVYDGTSTTLDAGTYENIYIDDYEAAFTLALNGGSYYDAQYATAQEFYLKDYATTTYVMDEVETDVWYAILDGSGPVVVPCTVTFTTNHVDATSVIVNSGDELGAENIPAFTGGSWDAPAPTGASIITSDTNFNYTVAAPVVTWDITFSTNNAIVTEWNLTVNDGDPIGNAIPNFTGGSWDAPVPTAETVVNSNTNFNYTIPGPADPWAPTAETDEAAAAKIADLFPGTEVAANVTTYAMYTNLVDYIKGVTSQSEVPGDITDAQEPWLWKSFILGANPLFVTNAVVTITDVNAAATAGEWDFIVKVTEGELTTAHSVAAAKVSALVKVTDSLSPASWSAPDPEDVHADLAPLLGTNLIKVTVDFGTDTSGFMKVSE